MIAQLTIATRIEEARHGRGEDRIAIVDCPDRKLIALLMAQVASPGRGGSRVHLPSADHRAERLGGVASGTRYGAGGERHRPCCGHRALDRRRGRDSRRKCW